MSEQVSEGIPTGTVGQERAYSVEGDHQPFAFRGDAKEYFGIWISNLLLSIVTLGIYSAWAKVRRERYFYGNTSVAGHALDYHANPIPILIGRLIAVFALLLVNFLPAYLPSSAIVLFPLLALLYPWILMRSLRFNARMSSYRNVRFDFHGNYWGAVMAFLIWPIIGILSIFILWPFASRAGQNYLAKNFSYGGRPIRGTLDVGPFYGFLFKSIVISLAIGFLIVIIAGLFLSIGGAMFSAGSAAGAIPVILVQLISISLLAVVPAYYATKARNYLYNTVVLDEMHGFDSRLDPWDIMGITFTNIIAIITTLGLMYPWAQIRLARYRAEHTSLIVGGDFDQYTSTLETDSATADAFGDVFDFEVAI